ncbi:Asp23/Gls24 family envelope stress response protein [Streptomyces sp. NPDC001292]|uniref:Asp23/Gls24 family envelope stress response protein n=1 Tax=Streptomyces sp. NPDC001292 TaxID=3364558 RepID=UPI0036883AF6
MSGGNSEPGTTPADLLPGERGATTIADRVVAKIAARAAREALGPLPSDAAPPHATVVVRHDVARVRIVLDLAYPADIGACCRAVRRQVVERVGALVGMQVPEVAVRVERLHLAPAYGAAQGRTR